MSFAARNAKIVAKKQQQPVIETRWSKTAIQKLYQGLNHRRLIPSSRAIGKLWLLIPLVATADYLSTYYLITAKGIPEAAPLAKWVLAKWGFSGLLIQDILEVAGYALLLLLPELLLVRYGRPEQLGTWRAMEWVVLVAYIAAMGTAALGNCLLSYIC